MDSLSLSVDTPGPPKKRLDSQAAAESKSGFPTTHGWLWSKSIARNPCGPRCVWSTRISHILMNDDLRSVHGNLRVPPQEIRPNERVRKLPE